MDRKGIYCNVMKLNLKKSALLLLNIILVIVMYLSWNLYASSYEGLPWYEPSGMQYIILYTVYAPVLLVITIALYLLGRYMKVFTYNMVIPALVSIIIIVPDWFKVLTKQYQDIFVLGIIFVFFALYIIYASLECIKINK